MRPIPSSGEARLLQMRITVWALETASEALLLTSLLIVLAIRDAPDQSPSSIQPGLIAGIFFAILGMFFTTGYLLTTGIARVYVRTRKNWLYPSIATALFLIHFEIMNIAMGGAFDPSDRLKIRIIGTGIAFATTYIGGLFLVRSTSTGIQRV